MLATSAISDLRSAANCSGVLPSTSLPLASQRDCASGARSALTAAPYRRMTMGCGRPAGPNIAVQLGGVWYFGIVSSNEATSGKSAVRLLRFTAITLTFPDLMKGATALTMANVIGIWPDTQSSSACAVALYGTCTSPAPVRILI